MGAPGAFMMYGALLGGVGAGVGMAVDSAFKTTIYDARSILISRS